ncbi:MAG: DUF2470 domain-containing protein [Hyphomicrobiales bacterium]|nr:DUF2470 domain-containing protein [Hyphomicrobiales bacterium]
MGNKTTDVIRATDADSIRLAKSLLRSARVGALAVIESGTGHPLASRVGVATDADGTPLILVSQLSAHTGAIRAEPRCALLVGETGKGDPLAHPRMTIVCRAAKLEPGTAARARAERRYINHNPKAKLYVGLGDFSFFRLEVERANLNGGFGKAYLMATDDLIVDGPVVDELAAAEQGALDHMNGDHLDAIANYASHFAKAEGSGWTMTGLDVDGFDLAAGDDICRVFFRSQLKDVREMRVALVDMAKEARSADTMQR